MVFVGRSASNCLCRAHHGHHFGAMIWPAMFEKCLDMALILAQCKGGGVLSCVQMMPRW